MKGNKSKEKTVNNVLKNVEKKKDGRTYIQMYDKGSEVKQNHNKTLEIVVIHDRPRPEGHKA